ncbi:MAG: flagellin [Butyrivibrio sp.]|nr:flagellin [Butyrivibrio sp.]
MGCGETFKFTFKSDTNENSFEGSTTIGSGTHHFTLGIADCENGTDIVNKMFDYIVEKFGAQQGLTPGADSLKVAHDNIMEKTGGAAFVIYAPGEGQATEAAAKNYFKSLHDSGSNRAKVDCSSLSGDVIDNENRDLWIQAGADKGDGMYVTIPRINGETVGVRSVDVTTGSSARSAIDTVKKGIEYISKERATLGAQQNRLEHTYKNVTNVEENTTAAESRIRDTDMADEMVRYSNNNILAQAGQAMLAQANQTNQGVLSLLQ